jgi:predicted alpha/beta hydrolase
VGSNPSLATENKTRESKKLSRVFDFVQFELDQSRTGYTRMRTIAVFLTLVLLAGETLALKPESRYVATPAEVGLSYDSINIPTKDGHRLTAWLCKPSQATTGSVIIAGGDAGNMSYSLNLAALLVSTLQVEVLLFDYRGFGSSSAFAIDTNILTYPEYLVDLRAAINWLAARSPSTKKLVFGRSMGASFAIGVGLDHRLDGIIAESPYSSQAELAALVNKKYRSRGSTRTISFIPNDLLDPVTTIARLTTPIALIGGEKDRSVKASSLHALYKLIDERTPKWLLIEGDAGHLEIAQKAPNTVAGIVSSVLAAQKER